MIYDQNYYAENFAHLVLKFNYKYKLKFKRIMLNLNKIYLNNPLFIMPLAF